MPQPLPDEVLSAAQSGDAEAFTRIYTDLAPKVSGYLQARGAEEPAESTQEVFLTVFSKLNSVRGGYRGLRTFAFSVAHARYVDEIRRRVRQPQLVGYEPDADARFADSAETVVLDSLDTSAVGELMQYLKAEQREVLLLRVVADLSLKQVSEITQRSTGSVKQLQRRGLLSLKELVERKEALS